MNEIGFSVKAHATVASTTVTVSLVGWPGGASVGLGANRQVSVQFNVKS